MSTTDVIQDLAIIVLAIASIVNSSHIRGVAKRNTVIIPIERRRERNEQ